MIEGNNSDIEADALRRRIRDEVARHKRDFGPSWTLGASWTERLTGTAAGIEVKDSYSLNDLLAYHDEDFVRNAYRAILRREPDPDGWRRYLQGLRTGELSKREILGRLRYSPEGRAHRVAIAGLLLSYVMHRAFRLPVIGRLAAIGSYFVRLPAIVGNLQRLEAMSHRRHLELSRAADRIAEAAETALRRLEHKADTSALASLRTEIATLGERKADAATLHALANEVATAHDQLQRFATATNQALSGEEEHSLDAFYATFEDRFRGPRDEIKKRVAVYLPIVEAAAAGKPDAPVLDVGCGRGEWLELLNEHGLRARGIDSNRIMVMRCKELDLDVVEADVLEWLRKLDADSLGAVTGFHIIEHLPYRTLLSLFDETLRVLKPGGVAIFETPNPENLVVAACNFYYDPTHRHPLPPEPMRYLAETRGFECVEIKRLHPLPVPDAISAELAAMAVGQWFTSAQDYSVIGYKPKARAD
jgi:SAM-dependent methyltransferase